MDLRKNIFLHIFQIINNQFFKCVRQKNTSIFLRWEFFYIFGFLSNDNLNF